MQLLTQHLRLLVKLIAVVAILSLVVLGAGYLDYQWDMTAAQIYSLSGQTTEVLESLEQPVTIFFFHTDKGRSAGNSRRLRRLAKRYAEAGARIEFKEVDPNRRPGLAREYKVSQNNTFVVKVGEQHKKLASYDLYSYKSRREKQFRGEAALTEALLKLTAATEKKVYFAKGLGEYKPTRSRERSLSQWAADLREEGFSVETLNVLSADLPDTDNLLVIVGPRRAYPDRVLNRLEEWGRKGGKLLLGLGPSVGPEFNSFFSKYGVKYMPQNVIDPERRSMQSLVNPFLFIPRLSAHPAVENLRERNFAVRLGRSGWLETSGDTVQAILKTSRRAFAKSEPPAGRKLRVEFNPERDQRGPFTVAASFPVNRGKVLLVATEQVLNNKHYGAAPGNKNFGLNLVNWVLDREVSLSIRPTPLNYNRVQVTAYQAYVMQLIAILGVPTLIILWGGIVWWKRKNR